MPTEVVLTASRAAISLFEWPRPSSIKTSSSRRESAATLLYVRWRAPRASNNNLYVADTGNSMVRRISPDGTVTVLNLSMAEVWLGPGWAKRDPFLGPNSRDAVARGSVANRRETHQIATAAGRSLRREARRYSLGSL